MQSGATDLWMRKISLLILPSTDPDSGTEKGLDLSTLRIRFRTHQADVTAQRPPWATIRVYNLSPSTEKTAIQEYNSVVLNAGYQNGKYGVIFKGQIKDFRRGHESTVDSFLDIEAAAGDIYYNFATTN